MFLVIAEKFLNIYIRNTVSISEHKRFIAYILLHTFDATTCHGIQASIYDGHFPRFDDIMMYRHVVLSVAEIKGNIRGI